jgi:hypothetical protein
MDYVGWLIGVIGVAFAVWQYRKGKEQGSNMTTFLIGLKAADLRPSVVTQINDMIARLK